MKKGKSKPNRHNRLKTSKKARSPLLGKEMLIMWAVILTAILWKPIAHEFLHKEPPRSILASKWVRYNPGQSGLSLLLPGEPQPENVGIPESSRAVIKQVNRYSYIFKDFHVAVWNTLYAEGLATDIKNAVDGAASAMKQSAGVSEYQDTVTSNTISGRPGVLLNGTFKRNDAAMGLKAVLVGEGSKLWQVIITYSASDRDEAIAAQKVLDSIQLGN